MRKSSKAAAMAGICTLVGVLVLAISPGAGRIPLGTMLVLFGVIGAVSAIRLRAAAN
ncbi:hypothetical protein SAMN05518801_101576 [Novosphingobium sp. CF614]|uniref:hypothetical protein n=1 Tax=Novosphingobium sp. CF614 TaxID=1884364 RepID=UPI0008E96D06|nr:hypothetical protein [Novosphingobium sp. CF614]SFF79520.1 hypothetical protein SAMN05518801_101576 [Novosphingobium sp. CF614]